MWHGPDYRAHSQYVAPARARPELWRLIFGLSVILVALVVLGQMFANTVAAVAEIFGADPQHMLATDGKTPSGVLVILFGYGLIVPSVAAVLGLLHDRSMGTLFGPWRSLTGQFVVVLLALVALNVVIELLPPWGYGADLVGNLRFAPWIALLPLSLLAIFVQTSAEEILFRGYIQQQLAARFSSPLIWMVVPSVLFGLLHYDTASQGENALYISVWAVLFGLAAADLTARSGTLGPAIALHFVNNAMALLFVSLPDGWHGLSLYVTPFSAADTEVVRAWLWVDLGFLCTSWLAARLAIRR